MAFFNARNTNLYHCTLTDVGSDVNYSIRKIENVSISKPEAGLLTLFNATSPGAAFDSHERYPPAKCHPGTRKEIQKEITAWTNQPSSKVRNRILWLHGPAGAGKSAIAQTIAEDCAQCNILAATFFFSRGRPGRDRIDRLFATIAYQIATFIPGLQPFIQGILITNPAVLHKIISTQVQQLIIEPLQAFATSSEGGSPLLIPLPFLVIIDGLDECGGVDAQREILQHILTLASTPSVFLRFLIVSRPDFNISHAFRQTALAKFCSNPISLYGDFKSYGDVRKYLTAEFNRIYTSPTHEPWMADVPKPWPPTLTLDIVVEHSDGYFIYAATLVRFVDADDDDLSPLDKLEIVSKPSSPGSGAFGELDKLYLQVLSTCRNEVLLRTVLMGVLAKIPITVIAQLFRLQPAQVSIALRRLQSVIQIRSDGIPHPIHASFSDFIFDPSRSGKFHIDNEANWAKVVEAMLDCLRRCSSASNGGLHLIAKTDRTLWVAAEYVYVNWFDHFERLGPHQESIIDEIQNMDLHCWFPLPSDVQQFPWQESSFRDMKNACASGVAMLLSIQKPKVKDPRLIEYFGKLLDVTLQRVLDSMYPCDRWIVYAFASGSGHFVSSEKDHVLCMLWDINHPLPYVSHAVSSQLWKASVDSDKNNNDGYFYKYLKKYFTSGQAVPRLLLDFKTTVACVIHCCLTFLKANEQKARSAVPSRMTAFPEYYEIVVCWTRHMPSARLGDEQLLESLRVVENAWLFWEGDFREQTQRGLVHAPLGSSDKDGFNRGSLGQKDFQKQFRSSQGFRVGSKAEPSLDEYNRAIEVLTSRRTASFNLEIAGSVLKWLMAHPNPQPRDQIKTWKTYFIKLFSPDPGKSADVRGDGDETYETWNCRIREEYRSYQTLYRGRFDRLHRQPDNVSLCSCVICDIRRLKDHGLDGVGEYL